MADPRKVGASARRRMGAPSSHLGMAEQWSPPYAGSPGGDAALSAAESTASGNAQIPIAGGRYLGTGGHLKGVPDTLDYPTDAVGRSGPPLAKDNASFASGVSSGVIAERHPPRSRLSAGESAGARLTVSPSMKVPQESPVPTQGQGRIVPSTPSRSGSFSQGQGEASFG
jgi:hypothetical protein